MSLILLCTLLKQISDFYCFHFSGHSYFYHFNYIFHLKNIYFRRTRNVGITTYLCFVFSFQVKKQNFMEIIAFDLQNFAFVTYSFIQRKLQCYCFSKSQYKNSPSKHIFFLQVKSSQTLFWQQGYTLRKIEGSHVLWDYEIQGAQHCFLGKNWDFLVTRGHQELLELSFGQGSHMCHWLVSKRALCKLWLQCYLNDCYNETSSNGHLATTATFFGRQTILHM